MYNFYAYTYYILIHGGGGAGVATRYAVRTFFWMKPGDDILAQTTRVNETTPACAYMIRATVSLGIGKW